MPYSFIIVSVLSHVIRNDRYSEHKMYLLISMHIFHITFYLNNRYKITNEYFWYNSKFSYLR